MPKSQAKPILNPIAREITKKIVKRLEQELRTGPDDTKRYMKNIGEKIGVNKTIPYKWKKGSQALTLDQFVTICKEFKYDPTEIIFEKPTKEINIFDLEKRLVEIEKRFGIVHDK